MSPNSAITISQNQPTDVIAVTPTTTRSSAGRACVWSFQSFTAKRAEQRKNAKPVQRGRGAWRAQHRGGHRQQCASAYSEQELGKLAQPLRCRSAVHGLTSPYPPDLCARRCPTV